MPFAQNEDGQVKARKFMLEQGIGYPSHYPDDPNFLVAYANAHHALRVNAGLIKAE